MITASNRFVEQVDPKHLGDCELAKAIQKMRYAQNATTYAQAPNPRIAIFEAEQKRRSIHSVKEARAEVSKQHPDKGGGGGSAYGQALARLDELRRGG